MPHLWRTPRGCYGFQKILCKAIKGFPQSVGLPARIMAVSHNPCAPLAQVVGKKLAQPGTSCFPMHPRAFGIGSKTVNSNNASIDGFVSVYYLDKVSNTHSTVLFFLPLGGTSLSALGLLLGSYNISNGRRPVFSAAPRTPARSVSGVGVAGSSWCW